MIKDKLLTIKGTQHDSIFYVIAETEGIVISARLLLEDSIAHKALDKTLICIRLRLTPQEGINTSAKPFAKICDKEFPKLAGKWSGQGPHHVSLSALMVMGWSLYDAPKIYQAIEKKGVPAGWYDSIIAGLQLSNMLLSKEEFIIFFLEEVEQLLDLNAKAIPNPDESHVMIDFSKYANADFISSVVKGKPPKDVSQDLDLGDATAV
jgi:hypothetical protein